MGSIYRRNHFRKGKKIGRGLIWWIQYTRGGKKIRESSGSPKREVAVRLLKKREAQIADGLPVTQRTGTIRMNELFEDLIADWKINERRSVVDLERRIEKHLLEFLYGKKAETISTADVRKFILLRQEEKASNAEINRELAALRRSFTLAIETGKLFSRPHIPMLRERNVRTGFFEREQFESVRRHLPEPIQAVISFAYITGWRIRSEVLPLQWRNVDFEAGRVMLDAGTTKNDQARTFPFTSDLRVLLEEQKAKADELKQKGTICPWVFNRDGLRIKTFRRSWKTACRLAGVPGRIPHDFRRTAVRNLVRAGIPERVAMTMTGHKTRAVFERYNIVSEGDLDMAARKLDEASQRLEPESASTSAAGQQPPLFAASRTPKP
jgi:integrase